MTKTKEEMEFPKKLHEFVRNEAIDIDMQYVSGVLLTMGALLCKMDALNYDTPLGTQMEYVNHCVNVGLTEGKKIFEGICKSGSSRRHKDYGRGK